MRFAVLVVLAVRLVTTSSTSEWVTRWSITVSKRMFCSGLEGSSKTLKSPTICIFITFMVPAPPRSTPLWSSWAVQSTTSYSTPPTHLPSLTSSKYFLYPSLSSMSSVCCFLCFWVIFSDACRSRVSRFTSFVCMVMLWVTTWCVSGCACWIWGWWLGFSYFMVVEPR